MNVKKKKILHSLQWPQNTRSVLSLCSAASKHESLGSPAPPTARQENCVPRRVPLFSRFMIAQQEKHVSHIVVDKNRYHIHQLNYEIVLDNATDSDTVSLQHVRQSAESLRNPSRLVAHVRSRRSIWTVNLKIAILITNNPKLVKLNEKKKTLWYH